MTEVEVVEVIKLSKASGFSAVEGTDLLLRDGEDLVSVCKLVELVRLATEPLQAEISRLGPHQCTPVCVFHKEDQS